MADLLEFIRNYGNASTSVLLIGAVFALWRDNVARQARYEAVLERCISALVRFNDYLDSQDEK